MKFETSEISKEALVDVKHHDDVHETSMFDFLTSPIQPSNCVIS